MVLGSIHFCLNTLFLPEIGQMLIFHKGYMKLSILSFSASFMLPLLAYPISSACCPSVVSCEVGNLLTELTPQKGTTQLTSFALPFLTQTFSSAVPTWLVFIHTAICRAGMRTQACSSVSSFSQVRNQSVSAPQLGCAELVVIYKAPAESQMVTWNMIFSFTATALH